MLWIALALASGTCPPEGDGLRLHLITVTPGGDLFSSMGHTALLFTAPGQPGLVLNWGAYDGSKASVPTFLRGELPYFLNRQPFDNLVKRTQDQGRTMIVQRLDLERAPTFALLKELELRARKETREYKYHWRDANCATKARDALDEVTGGALSAAWAGQADTTARFEGSRHLHRWPIPHFAWRLAVSSRLDEPMSVWERTMLPEHLMREVANARTERGPLVDATCTMVEGSYGWAPEQPPASWPPALPGLLGSVAVLGAARTGRTRTVGALTTLYGTVLGVLGTASFGLWALGTLEGVGPTDLWTIAGPWSWGLAVAGVAAWRGRFGARSRGVALVLAAVGLLGGLVSVVTPARNGDVVLALLPGLLACVAALWVAHPRGNDAGSSRAMDASAERAAP